MPLDCPKCSTSINVDELPRLESAAGQELKQSLEKQELQSYLQLRQAKEEQQELIKNINGCR